MQLVKLLDRHTEGGLKKRHYANWYLAFEQMTSEFAELEKALKEADASVAWMNAISVASAKKTWEP